MKGQDRHWGQGKNSSWYGSQKHLQTIRKKIIYKGSRLKGNRLKDATRCAFLVSKGIGPTKSLPIAEKRARPLKKGTAPSSTC